VQPNLSKPGREFVIGGAVLMILIALFLIIAALYIGYDAWRAYNRMKTRPAVAAPAE
jgi:hypothetical protein